MRSLNRLIQEIHRRSLWQVLGIYLVASWIAYEVVLSLTEGLGLPPWFPGLAIVLLIVGLPVVLATAFVQEGVVSARTAAEPPRPATEPAADTEPRQTRGGLSQFFTWRNAIAGGVLAFALWGAVAAGWLLLSDRPALPADSEAAASAPETEQSIAVLPFANLSSERETEYFSDGITEEILNALGQVPGLRVAARTSSFAFRDEEVTAEEIGQHLGVTYLLDGSVRKEGNRVRISAQLVNAAGGYQLWSERFERELSSVFAIQDEIARAIVRKLQLELEGGAPDHLVSSPTDDLDAYERYLRGRHFWSRRTGADLQRAIEYFEQAAEADPEYAKAHAGLAEAYVLLPFYSSVPQGEAFERAIASAEKALELDPSLAGPHAALGFVRSVQFRWVEADRAHGRAIELNPSYATAHQWRAWTLLTTGRTDEAMGAIRLARELDPLSRIINLDLGLHLYIVRRNDEAIGQLRATLELDSTNAYARSVLGLAYLRQRRAEAALRELERAVGLSGERWPPLVGNLGYAYAVLGREAEARELLDELEGRARREPIRALSVAYVYLGLGQSNPAIDWIERAVAENDPGLIFDSGGLRSPEFDPLREHSRFERLLEKMNL